MAGATALDCLRMHCRGDHSVAGQNGDVDGVMQRIAETFRLDTAYKDQPTLAERCTAFVQAALDSGLMRKE